MCQQNEFAKETIDLFSLELVIILRITKNFYRHFRYQRNFVGQRPYSFECPIGEFRVIDGDFPKLSVSY